MQLQKIDIDWDIHKLIEGERRGFDEPPFMALRRLLKLPPLEAAKPVAPAPSAGRAWVEDGVEVPHGSAARMTYLRGTQVYEGQFLNGKLVVNGKEYLTLSAAADDLAVTKKGTKTSLNGWNYWEVMFPGDTKWTSLSSLRVKAKLSR